MKTANGFFFAVALFVAYLLGADSSFADHGYIGRSILPALVILGVVIGQLMALAARTEKGQS